MDLVYLDNAATSWPKPPGVAAAMTAFLAEIGGNPGRAGHRLAVDSARVVYMARETVAELFSVKDPLRVVFGHNATWALNLALSGLLRPGDHVITSSVEHNAMMRPLRHVERTGVELTVMPCAATGELDPAAVESAVRRNTVMIALTHASNVTGTLLPIHEVGRIAREHDLVFLADTAQSAGAVTIDMEENGIDLLAFTGHKSLCGPMGTGGLVVGPRVDPLRLQPLVRGGTGSNSDSEEQPEFLPDRYESGTPNVVGLAGLAAGVRWVLDRGVADIRAHETILTERLLHGLSAVKGLTIHGPSGAAHRVGTVSFTLDKLSPTDAALRLDEQFGVLVRAGLHCAPACHRTIGTFPDGTIRFSLGPLSRAEDADRALDAVRRLVDES